MRKSEKRRYVVRYDDALITKLSSYNVNEDGTCTVEFEVELEVESFLEEKGKKETSTKNDTHEAPSSIYKLSSKKYVVIEASKLSVKDEFMNYSPQTFYEKSFRGNLLNVLKQGMKDFCKPIYDPSLSSNGITYEPNQKPAVGLTFLQWFELAKAINPDANSRIGNREEYVAFLGFLIKKMVEGGLPLELAWHYVCNDSSKIGIYSTGLSFQNTMQKTGTKESYGFFDLANTQKVVLSDLTFGTNFFWKAGGSYQDEGASKPLASFEFCTDSNIPLSEATGWIIWDA